MKNKTKLIHYIIIAIVTIIIMIPFFNQPLVDTDDGKLHLLRIIGVGEALQTGMLPPVISPSFCNTWGYAINLFYNPLTTYGPILLSSIFDSYAICIKIFIGISIFLAGIFMYKFAKEITNKENISILSAVLYITTPYYLSDIYIRGALGEFVALTFIPLVFLGLYNLFQGDKSKHYYIAIGATLLLLTHTITTIYTAILCVIYILFNIKKLKDKDILKKCFINIIFILIITLFFTVPLILNKMNAEYTIFNKEIMNTSSKYLNYEALDLMQLFAKQPDDEIIFKIGLPNLIGLILIIFTYKNIEEKNKKNYTILCFLAILCLIMTLKYFPWMILPDFLGVIQFPWRMLGFAGCFLSIITAINLEMLLNKILKNKTELINYLIIPCICLIVLYTKFIGFSDSYKNRDSQYENMTRNNMVIGYYQINREYMPLKAYLKIDTDLTNRDNKLRIIDGQANIQNEVKENLKVTADLNNIENNTIIEAPFLYYLGYNAYIIDENNNKQEIEVFESENGFVAFKLQNIQNTEVVVEYKTPISYYVSIIISLIGAICFVIYIKSERTTNERKN